jgi:hypothetical protein
MSLGIDENIVNGRIILAGSSGRRGLGWAVLSEGRLAALEKPRQPSRPVA